MYTSRKTHGMSGLVSGWRLLLILLLAAVPGLAAVEDDATTEPSLMEIGIDLEVAGTVSRNAGEDVARAVLPRLTEKRFAGSEQFDRSVWNLLMGEAHLALGEEADAEKAFKNAAGSFKDKNLEAFAEMRRITTLELSGRHDAAAQAWDKWLAKYGDTSLQAEARLSRIWTDIRRGKLADASLALTALGEDHPWLTPDNRYELARAMLTYLGGEPKTAIQMLSRIDPSPAGSYLRGLCHQDLGQILKAAAAFQEVAQGAVAPTLRDHALLAKANAFLISGVYQSAAEEFAKVARQAADPDIAAEASLRRAAATFMAGNHMDAAPLLRQVIDTSPGTDVAARAQFLLGEVMFGEERYEDAITEFNQVLTAYFDQDVAASAQYRVGRCLDALDRRLHATGAYQAVVSGYPLSPEAPAAAYLAGVSLLEQDRHRDAAPYFQLVLDRYAISSGADGTVVYAAPEHAELVEASLCLLELSYHRAGDLGQLAGAPHTMLHNAPETDSQWRAYSLLIDADAQAAQRNYDTALASLDKLLGTFPSHAAAVSANQLLAWIHAEMGDDESAIQAQKTMLARYADTGNPDQLSQARLSLAHVLFNRQDYTEAASGYEEFLAYHPNHSGRHLALYQAGLCYMRLDQAGDAVDRWETIMSEAPTAEIAERAWARAGDVYFQADRYDDAQRCYRGLLTNFTGSEAVALGLLRVAQCDFNAGRDKEALAGYSTVVERFPYTRESEESKRGIELALYRLGQDAGGVADLRQLVEDYPSSSFAADAQFQIASQLYEQGNYVASTSEFRRVVSQFPTYESADRAQFLLGDAQSQTGQDEQARQTYEQFLLLFTDSDLYSQVQFRLAMQYFGSEDYLRAAINFTGLLEQEPDENTACASRYNLALCRRLLGQDEAALLEFEQYRQIHGSDERSAEVAYQMAEIHELAGRTTQAVTELKTALTSSPGSPLVIELKYRLGRCNEQLGDVGLALAAYVDAASGSGKGDAYRLSALARAAEIYEERKEYAQAATAYRDLAANTGDPSLATAASERASQLDDFSR